VTGRTDPSSPAAHPVTNIAFVSDVVYPYTIGGSEYRIYSLLRRAPPSVRTTFFAGQWWDGAPPNGGTVGLPILRRLYRASGSAPKSKRGWLEPATFSMSLFTRSLEYRAASFDVIEMNQSPLLHFGLLPVLRRTRMARDAVIVGTLHEVWNGLWNSYYAGVEAPFGARIETYAQRNLDHIVTISEQNGRALRALGIPETKVSVISPGVDFAEIQSAPWDGVAKFDLIYSGRLTKEKGLSHLVRGVAASAEARARGLKVAFVGDGVEVPSLRRLAKELGVEHQFAFLGRVSRPEMIAALKGSKLYIQPTAPEGGSSVSMLEACAAGLPVVTSKDSVVGVGNEVVEDGSNGLLARRPEEVLDRALGLLSDEPRRTRMAANAVIMARGHDWESVAARTFALYERLSQGRSRRAA
jgi:glycosyltransferase involved in cell wall biosynthesis